MRLVHLARASAQRGIERAGIRGAAWSILTAERTDARRVPRAVFATPVLPDYAMTYQWLRELRRWHDERMIAVHFRIPDDELVFVGRYGERHDELRATDAARAFRARPAGAEILVPRSIGRRDVVSIREMSQLVGWTHAPGLTTERRPSCVCPVCLPRSVPDRFRQIRAVYTRGLAAYRRAKTFEERKAALDDVERALEAGGDRLDARPLVRLRPTDARLRRSVARMLGHARFAHARDALLPCFHDADESVRDAAADALRRAIGPKRAAVLAVDAGAASAKSLLSAITTYTLTNDAVDALAVLARHPSSDIAEEVRAAIATLAEDDVENERVRRRLAAALTG